MSTQPNLPGLGLDDLAGRINAEHDACAAAFTEAREGLHRVIAGMPAWAREPIDEAPAES